MNASMRTTTAITIVHGGVGTTPSPPKPEPLSTFACAGDTIADVLWRIKKVIKDDRVKFSPVEGKFNEALPILVTLKAQPKKDYKM